MKLTELETKTLVDAKTKRMIPQPPPLPPPLPKLWSLNQTRATVCVTNQEIARFWRRKRIEEEDHLLAAIKSAARLRARNLMVEDYDFFEVSLKNKKDKDDPNKGNLSRIEEQDNKEVRVGIKDWWTKSKYAYLNQPAIGSSEPPKRRTTSYIPNCLSCKPTPLYPTSVGVF